MDFNSAIEAENSPAYAYESAEAIEYEKRIALPKWPIERIVEVIGWLRDKNNLGILPSSFPEVGKVSRLVGIARFEKNGARNMLKLASVLENTEAHDD